VLKFVAESMTRKNDLPLQRSLTAAAKIGFD
jgi:hypothetical protein